jgi:hypothetical protein
MELFDKQGNQLTVPEVLALLLIIIFNLIYIQNHENR